MRPCMRLASQVQVRLAVHRVALFRAFVTRTRVGLSRALDSEWCDSALGSARSAVDWCALGWRLDAPLRRPGVRVDCERGTGREEWGRTGRECASFPWWRASRRATVAGAKAVRGRVRAPAIVQARRGVSVCSVRRRRSARARRMRTDHCTPKYLRNVNPRKSSLAFMRRINFVLCVPGAAGSPQWASLWHCVRQTPRRARFLTHKDIARHCARPWKRLSET